MNLKLVALVLVIGLLTVGGVCFLLGAGSNEKPSGFTVGSAGGTLNYLDKVVLVVETGTFNEETEISITESTSSSQDSSVDMLSEYEFGPSGLIFDPPAELIIHYDPQDLPATTSENSLGIYVLQAEKWTLINGSNVNLGENTVSAPITHFSKMGAGAPSSSSNSNPEPSSDDEEEVEDGIALAWFKANISFKTASTRDENPNHASQYDKTTYGVAAHVSWNPATYVMYYQVKFDFHGNPPEDYPWSEDYSERTKWAPGPYGYREGLVYSVGLDPYKPNYIGPFKMAEEFGGRHGFVLGGFYEEIYDTEVRDGLNVELFLPELEQFTYAYFDGWEIWVRPIVETHN
jgi:hypothetical protein